MTTESGKLDIDQIFGEITGEAKPQVSETKEAKALTDKEREVFFPWLNSNNPEIPESVLIENITINGENRYFSTTIKEYVALYDKIGEKAWSRQGLVEYYNEGNDLDFKSCFHDQRLLEG